MGHGASTLPQVSLACVFGLTPLQTGNAELLGNDSLRNSFLNYVKGGLWVDRIVETMLFMKVPISHEERLAREKQNVVYEYKMMPGASEVICKPFTRNLYAENSTKGTTSVSNAGSLRGHSERISECYVNIEDCDCFTAPQLIAILFSVVYPMYLGSKQYQQLLKFGRECDDGEDKDSAGDPPSGNKTSRRAQEILLGTAAYFDESTLREQLETTDWVKTLGQTFENYKLAISVCDTSKEGYPLVYVNRAFESMTGRQRAHLLGKGLDVLNGAETEAPMLEHVHEALRTNHSLKVALTHYTAMGRTFTDLVAMRPQKAYMMAVHVVSNKNSRVSDLALVDDVLTLMSYLVKPPKPQVPAPLKKGLSGLSSWIAAASAKRPSSSDPAAPAPNARAHKKQ